MPSTDFKFNLKRDPAAGLPPEGVHRFIVEAADPKPGGDKGPLLTLRLRLYPNGVKHNSAVFDNLPTSEESRWKVDQFFNSVGAPADGEAGPAWFVNRSGYARFVNGLNKDGDLRCNVKKYLTPGEAEALVDRLAAKNRDGDEVPAQRSRQPVAEAATTSRKASSKKVAELDDDDKTPF